ncbi:MAG: VWA domain-containing protein [bacterium]|nr:VWA domain-containing protein [bacterium]
MALVSVLLMPLAAAAAADATAAQSPVRILVKEPKPGEALRNNVHQAPIRGSAVADGERPAEFDVMLVIDVSGSTKQASGIDVDGDGAVGFNPQLELVEPGLYPPDMQSTDLEDTILAAEVAAAEALVGTLDPERVRVGVISFSGEMHPETGERAKWNQQDAWLDVPLTSNHQRAVTALRGIMARGPHGGTNFAAGVRLAVRELVALSGAKSSPRSGAKKVILFLTDGTPTFPIGVGSAADPGDTEAALSAARLARKAGITMNTYALGPNALTNPIAATEMARLTLGSFLAVRNPGDIISFLQGVTFANIEDVVFTNLTTREISTDVDLSPDGSFSGFVPVREGLNRVRITALASDGSSGSVEIDLVFETSDLSARELARELGRIRDRNKQLMLLLERDRIQKFRENQRKVLKFDIDDEAKEEDR